MTGQPPFLGLHAVNVFVRDQDESLRFYVGQLGFHLAFDARLQSGERWVAVAPPDGTAVLALVAPPPDSRAQQLIGRPTGIVFVTEDVIAKYEEWRKRGVQFSFTPRLRRVKYERQAPASGATAQPVWGGVFTRFRDPDGNSFAMVGFDEVNRQIEAERRGIAEKLESERRAAQELEIAKQVQARLFPQRLPPIPTLDYAGACIQARQVGGDYHDFLDLGGGRCALVVADISGKGMPAALLMANLQANLRSQCAVALDEPARENSVGPGYFSAFGIPLLAGREFTASDDEHAPKVAIINETFARFLFGNDTPAGRHIRAGADDTDIEIVGVVKDSKYGGMREKPGRFLYVPYEQGGDEFTKQAAFFVRTRGGDSSVMTAVRGAVKQLDRNLPIQRLTSMRLLIDDSIYTDRLLATLAIAFGVLATVLAAVGLYGTISYSVARRTREFGIRLALGAAPQSLLRLIMREMGWLILIGVGVALPASYALARLVESQLYGIRAHDPLVMLGSTLLLVLAAAVAGLGPAIRAMRIEPVRALRYE